MLVEKIVTIGDEEYLFTNQIGESRELLASFNELASRCFGISFHEVGRDYEPHVLVKNHTVCANISVNQIPFLVEGHKKLYIQLGTVMTLETERNKGLSRWLMEAILKEWEPKCDGIYLFANDSVLNFYPKFGFVEQVEYEYVKPWLRTGTSKKKVSSEVKSVGLKPLDVSEPTSYELVKQKYKEGNPFAAIHMYDNKPIFEFYYRGLMKTHIYYIKEYDVIVTAALEEDTLICYEVLGKTDASLNQILKAIAIEFEQRELLLGFTPIDSEPFLCRIHKEEDTTLFWYNSGENPMNKRKCMFPLLTHA